MNHKRIGFIFGVLLLILMSACGPATATPTSPPPVSCVQTGCAYPAVCDQNSGQCVIYQTPQAPASITNNHVLPSGAIVANNPNPIGNLPQFKVLRDCGEVQIYYPAGYKLYFDSSIQNSGAYSYPAGFPPDGMGEGFFGPAGASLKVQECPINAAPGSSQCLNINETFGTCPNPTATKPALVNPPGPGAGQLLPACVPPVPSISNVESFCANPSAGIGGASFVWDPSQEGPPPGWSGTGWADTEESGAACQWGNGNQGPKVTCTGTQGGAVKVLVCTQCGGAFTGLTSPKDFVCPPGSVPQGGSCDYSPSYTGTPDPNTPSKFYLCPSGSHFDNAQQNCVDDVSGNPVSGLGSESCPANYPYYDIWGGMCTKLPLHQYSCQYFSVPLGTCAVQQKVCQPPAGGCGINPLNGAKKTWHQATCSCS